MATLTRNDVSIMMKYLAKNDDYDKAMKHFLDLASGPGVMEQSIDLPKSMEEEITKIHIGTIHEMNSFLNVRQTNTIRYIRFFYIKEFDLVHCMFMNYPLQGTSIYFPGLSRGALAIIKANDPETHFVKITAFPMSGGEA